MTKLQEINKCLDHYSLKVSSDIPVVIDTGASFSLTPIIDDFIEDIKPAPINEIQGLTHRTKVVGEGFVEWKVRDHLCEGRHLVYLWIQL